MLPSESCGKWVMSRSEILLEAAGLEDEGHVRIVCPTCGGGSSKERSLSLRRTEGTVLWNCHRASCNERGASGDRGSYFVRTKQEDSEPRRARITPYEGELVHLPEEWLDYLEEKIGWTTEHMAKGRAMLAAGEDRVAYPIFSPLGYRRGWVLRSYDPSERTKTLTRMDVEEPHLSWYRHVNNASCVVVEDIPSAVRASLYTDSVALCGTGCNREYAMEIAAHYKDVVWALDADATDQAIRLMRKYALLFESSRVLTLENDLKDTEEKELCVILSEL